MNRRPAIPDPPARKGFLPLGLAAWLGGAALLRWQAPWLYALVALLVALAIWAARRPNKYFWLLTGLAIASAIYVVLAPTRLNIAAVYGIPHAAINLFLFWLFGRTLLRGRDALITRVARRVHGTLPPQLEMYTRQVTIAWCVFFAGQIIISILLFSFAPIATWSLYINFLDLPLVALMFLAEYAYRKAYYRSHPHTPIWKTVQAFTKDFSSSEGADAR